MLPDDGYHEFELSGDAFTIVSFPYHQKEFDDFTYEITPIFMTKPSNINTNETIVCALTDSDEATGEVYEYDGEWYGLSSIRSITIPGADGLRVEITYTFPPEYLRLGVIEGGAQELYYANSYYFSSYDNEISGSKVINIEGDMATFDFSGYYPYDEKDEYISNYGFSAKIYPIYNNEIEGTIPTQICKIVEKSGTYREPDYFDNGCWVWYWKPENTFDYSSMIDPGSLGRFGIKSWLYLNYDLFSGTILNFYSYNNCMS
jgi:hypothetical protein